MGVRWFGWLLFLKTFPERREMRWKDRRARVGWLVILISAFACTGPVRPSDLSGIEPFVPLAGYRDLWTQVEGCSDSTGDFDRVRWYVTTETRAFEYRGQQLGGYWFPSHEIVLGSGFIRDEKTIRHEMLHDILNSAAHQREYFVTRCGSLIAAATAS